MSICAFDPGLITGFAMIGPNDFICADILTPANESFIFNQVANSAVCYIERPMFRPGKERNPQDLLTLSCKSGEFFGRVKATGKCQPSYLFPHDWKRSLNKTMTADRISEMLSEKEKKMLANVWKLPESRRHNALDALGIALWGVGRKVFNG